MQQLERSRILLFSFMLLLVLSVVIGVVSMCPAAPANATSAVDNYSSITDVSFVLTPLEMRRHGLGSFRGGENISISVNNPEHSPFNFSVESYNGTYYSSTATGDIEYSFTAEPDYYEVVFSSESTVEIHFAVSAQKSTVFYPFSWLNTPAKVLFFFSLASIILLLLNPSLRTVSVFNVEEYKARLLSPKGRRILLILILLSLALWFFLVAVNTNPLGSCCAC